MVLQTQGFPIERKTSRKVLKRRDWPGRLEIVGGEPPIILDGAHNIAGAESLKKYCKRFLSCKAFGAFVWRHA